MALSGSIPHLINGVSKQVASMRLPTHVEDAYNRLMHPATGNQKRPPLQHVAQLPTALSGDVFYHSINRDRNERYHVLITNGDLFVFDKDGAQKTVTFPDGKLYLSTAFPSSFIAAATSADYTFITNKTKTVLMDPTVKSEARGQEALIFCRSANFSRTYRIRINGVVVAEWQNADGTGAEAVYQRLEAEAVTPTALAKTLMWGNIVNFGGVAYKTNTTQASDPFVAYEFATVADLNGRPVSEVDGSNYAAIDAKVNSYLAKSLSPTEWYLKRYNNVIHIKNLLGNSFTISSETDRDGGTDSIVTIKDRVQSFNDLPNHGPLGFVCRVAGTPTDNIDDYYVKIDKADANDTNDGIVWKECPAPDISIAFDKTTMPHVLVRNSDGTFTFKKADWVNRKVGAPPVQENPSFVNRPINDILFSRGRLCFLTSENFVTTRPSEFFDFWRTTATAVLDDDPIDIAGTDDNVSIFRYGVAFNEDIYLFSDQTVHKVTSGDIMSPKNVALPTAVVAQINTTVPPAVTPKSILFLGSTTSYTDIREIFNDPNSDEAINSSVSDHVPGYIPTNIKQLVTSDTVSMAVAVTTGAPAQLFVYHYFWSGNEKLQAAWGRWTLADNAEVIGCAFWDDFLHLVLRRGTTLFIERANCSAKQVETNGLPALRLDRRVLSFSLAAPVYNAAGNYSDVTLPYTPTGPVQAVHYGGFNHGTNIRILSVTGNVVRCWGNLTGATFAIGLQIDSGLVLSRFYMREKNGDNSVILNSGPFRVLRLSVQVSDTASLRSAVKSYADGEYRITNYAPLVPSDSGSNIGTLVTSNAPFSVPVKARSDRAVILLQNNTPLPDCITGIEWFGEYDLRAQRV